MSKVDKIKEQFPNITKPTFEKFVKGDKTATKKYLLWMCNIWTQKKIPLSIQQVIDLANHFEIHISYLVNKDIYHKDYNDVEYLVKVLDEAQKIKEDKTFDREKNARVVYEDENYLALIPTTFKGSLKYGSNTKWCTASKSNPNHFDSYSKKYIICYLIDLKNQKKENYNKIAFLISNTKSPTTSDIVIYNQKDDNVTEDSLYENGWDYIEINKILFSLRTESIKFKKEAEALNKIKSNLKYLELVNLDEIYESLNFLKSLNLITEDNDFEKKVTQFYEKIKTKNKN